MDTWLAIAMMLILLIILTCSCTDTFSNTSNTSNNFEIFIINLDRSTERLARMKEIFDSKGLKFRRISAVNGGGKTVSEISKDAGYNHDLSCLGPKNRLQVGNGGAAGCYFSHLKCWREFLKGNKDKLLVLEDDAEFILENYDEIINKLVSDNSNFIWLNSESKIYKEMDRMPPWGTQGYIIDRYAANKLLEILTPGSKWFETGASKCKGRACLIDMVLPCAVKDMNLKWRWVSLVKQRENIKSEITGKISESYENEIFGQNFSQYSGGWNSEFIFR